MPQPVAFASPETILIGARLGGIRRLPKPVPSRPVLPPGHPVSRHCKAGECRACRGRVLNPDLSGPQYVPCGCLRSDCNHHKRRTGR